MDKLNKVALRQFINQPVSRDIIAYLAKVAEGVLPDFRHLQDESILSTGIAQCQRVHYDDSALPTLEEFIFQLVISSGVPMLTLMSTLIYLTRLKSKLQPKDRGLPCTPHRIFLASIILAAKYLDDYPPKNKRWVIYARVNTEMSTFGFKPDDVNLMEKQLIYLLAWDLTIKEEDLYRELEPFLEPLRLQINERRTKNRRHPEKKRQQA